MATRSALIVGATGLVGQALLEKLLLTNHYQKVTIFTRHKLNVEHPKLRQYVVNFDQLEKYQEQLRVDDLYCCLGTTIKKAKTKDAFKLVDYHYPLNLAKLAAQAGTKQFIVITAMGADPRSFFFYNRVKGELEEALRHIKLPAVQIIRPSLLLGDRNEYRLGESLASQLSRLFPFIFKGRLAQYAPIHAAQVAQAMKLIALKSKLGYHIHSNQELLKLK